MYSDTHISSKCERSVFIYVKHFPLIRTRLMHQDRDNKRPHSIHALLISHGVCREIDEPKI